MSFTFDFRRPPTSDDTSDLPAWLNGQGEPFEEEAGALRLRALPMVLTANDLIVRAVVDVGPQVRLARLIGLLFELALWLGTDVKQGGQALDRAQVWLRLADDQDRLRIAQAIERAGPRTEEVLAGLWQLLRAVGRGQDLRWDPRARGIVEVQTRWEDASSSLDPNEPYDATEETDPLALLCLPVRDGVHIFAWRWLAEAWPALTS